MVYKTYDVGNHLVGIRSNSEEAGEWLDDTFSDYEITDEEADPFLSIFIAEEGIGRRYHILYKEAVEVARTFDPAQLARRLVLELDVLTLRKSAETPYLEACVLRRNGLNALVPADIVPYVRQLGRKVEQELALPPEPIIGVDSSSGRLFSVPPQLDIPEAAFTDLARRVGMDGAKPSPPADIPESVDLVCMFHYDPEYPDLMPLTRALAVHALARETINMKAVGGRALEPLAKVVEGKRCFLLQEGRPEQAYELLTGVLDGDEAVLNAVAPV